jgi:integrase
MGKFVEGCADKLEVPPGKRDVQAFDDELPGFGVRKFKNGSASYFVKYQVGLKQRRITLGRVVRGNLKDMRLLASEVLAKARLGTDVAGEKEKAKREAAEMIPLGELVPKYLKQRRGELREKSYVGVEHYLTKTWRPLHATSIKDVDRQSTKHIINGLEHKVAADRARTALSTFFAWAIEEGHCENNPTMNIKSRGRSQRTRVLSEPELIEVWRACLDDDFGIIIKLLILTGQRRGEIGGLRPAEISLQKGQIELPAARTKNHRPHIIPLSTPALELLGRVEGSEERRHLFGDGANGYNSYDRRKRELDARIAATRGGKPLAHWTLHDIRRSFVTHIAEAGFAQPHVIEAIVNHIGAAKAGIAGVYNRATYLKEKRETLERWASYVVGQVDAPRDGQSPEHGKSRQTTR